MKRQQVYYRYIIWILFPIACLHISCKKYLDAKPSKGIVIASSTEDLQALLDASNIMNFNNYPGLLEIVADDYELPQEVYDARSSFEKENYRWEENPTYEQKNVNQNWTNSYSPIFYANTVLDELPNIKTADAETKNRLKGAAYFFRAFSFYHLAQIFCKPYEQESANDSPGIPLRLTADFNVPSKRATVKQTYDQIVQDLVTASELLPIDNTYQTRPNKSAAFAALARVYLSMGDYEHAAKYADQCLQLFSTLIDYNQVSPEAKTSFSPLNAETIFYAYSAGSSMLSSSRANVNKSVYASYAENDLRKIVLFMNKDDGEFGFKGSYIGVSGGGIFVGLATDEIMLIRAECYARAGNIAAAMLMLNQLLEKRWLKGTFQPLVATDADDALKLILLERRKELLFRGLRWSDLRRLNRDPRFAVTLTREIIEDGKKVTYTLPPNDLRYVLLIPPSVISITGMQQNPRN